MWYNNYVGFPYKHLGDDPIKGIDCYNLCRYTIFKETQNEISISSKEICKDDRESWYNRQSEQIILNFARERKDLWLEVSSPKPFDIVVFSLGSTNVVNHCALYVGDNKILQICQGRNSWIAPFGRYYKDSVDGIFRWKKLIID